MSSANTPKQRTPMDAMVVLRVPASVYARLGQAAYSQGMDISKAVREAIDAWLDAHNG